MYKHDYTLIENRYRRYLMAKGRRNYTLEEQLEKITKEIANMEQSLAEMKIAKLVASSFKIL